MVLRHLQNLSRWNRHGGTPPSVGVNLQGHLDFSNLGMMGHSRGGDGVRAAYNDYIAHRQHLAGHDRRSHHLQGNL